MKCIRRTFTLTTLLAAAAAAALAPTAHAAVPRGAPTPPGQTDPCAQPPGISADGTSGTCTDPNYLHSCTAQVAACKTLVGPAFASFYDAHATGVKKVVLPAEMPHPVDATHAGMPGTLYDAVGVKSAPVAITLAGTGATYENGLASLQLGPYQQYGATYATYTPLFQPDEQSINACAEYVYKKWYRYSWFDEVARLASGDPAHVAAVALVGAPGQGFGGPTLVNYPTRIDGQPISANGTMMPYLAQGSGIARNTFLAHAAFFLDATDPTQAAIAQAVSTTAGAPLLVDATNDVVWASSVLNDLIDVPDAKFRDNERRMNAFADQYVQYADLQNAYFHDRLARACLAKNLAACGQWDAEGGDVYAGSGFGARVFGSSLERRQAAIAYFDSTMASTGLLPSGRGYRAYPAQTSTWYLSAMTQLQAQQATVGQHMAKAFVDEWGYDENHGCLGYTKSNGPNMAPQQLRANSCDFMPSEIVQRYVGLFQKERQTAYDRCMRATGDDFTIVADPNKQGFVTWPKDRGDFHGSLSAFEGTETKVPAESPSTGFLFNYEHRDELNARYQALVDKYLKALRVQTADLPVIGSTGNGDDTPPASHAFGQSKQDSNEKGGEWFGGGYSYGYDWNVTPRVLTPGDTTSPICGLSGSAGARFEAHAMVLKQKVQVVDAAFKVSSQPGKAMLDQAHFTFLDQSYFNADGKDFTGTTFDQPIDKTPLNESFSVPIPIGPFVLSMGGGASLHVGAKLHAAVVAPPECNPDNLTWSLNASITPNVRADAFAFVAIDLLIASAGVEGQVELFGAELPLTADIHLERNPVTSAIELSVSNDATLKMTELAGRVVAYAEIDYVVGKNRAELELFSWDGFHQDVPLWHLGNKYPLEALTYRLYGHYDPSKVHG